MYSICIECSNQKVKCEFFNKEFKKIYLSKHIKRCIIKYNNFTNDNENHENENIIITNDNENHNNENQNDIPLNNEINNDKINLNKDNNNMFNRTILVGPSFCGKTHLLLNKLQLFR